MLSPWATLTTFPVRESAKAVRERKTRMQSAMTPAAKRISLSLESLDLQASQETL